MEIDPRAVPELGLRVAPIARRDGARVVDAEGREYVDLEGGPESSVPEEVARASGRWRLALENAAREEALDVALVGRASAPAVVFAGQEGAPAELMAHVFAAVMRAHGVLLSDRLRVVEGLAERELETVERALVLAFRRMRALLVELNSYLCGGWDYPFATERDVLRERGVAFYRFPRRAPTALEVAPNRLVIRFAAGDLGAVTSSGFYVPTPLAADFEVRVRYRLLDWQAGDDAASFALFMQDEPSLSRFYVQRSSCRRDGEEHAVFANYTGELEPRRAVRSPAGSMRIVRQADTLRLEHGDARGEGFECLGERCGATRSRLFVGAKIWGKGPSGPLAVALSDLVLEGELSAPMPPPVPVRPDPRGAES